MKSLSILQPHASLVANGIKHFETRSWATKHRGNLVICASKHRLTEREQTASCFDVVRFCIQHPDVEPYPTLPFGMALCIVDLTGCYSTRSYPWEIAVARWTPEERVRELRLGDHRPGRFAWRLENVRRFKEPWPVRGRQGLFEIPDEEIAKHELWRLHDRQTRTGVL